MSKLHYYEPGDQIGACILIKEIGQVRGERGGLFRCDCGNEFEWPIKPLRAGTTKGCPSCTSANRSAFSTVKGTTHGMHDYPEYPIWKGIKKRCYNENAENYPYYGGRGIKVCDRWLKSFENFYEDMGPRPSRQHTIERFDHDGDYEPSNCGWLLKVLQSRNTRANTYLTFRGETKIIEDWGRELNVRPGLIRERIGRLGWDTERALTTPPDTRPKRKRQIRHAFGFIALLLLFCGRSFAQSETNNPVTYDTTISETANGEGPFKWNVRITRQKSDMTPRPVIMAIHGSGEVGTDTSLLTVYGPHYWLLNGWDGSVPLGNGTHYPVIVTIQQPVQNMRPWHLKAVVETLFKVLPIKQGSVHVAGLSQGSYEWGELIGFAATAGDQTAMSEIKSWVDLEGVGPGDNFLGFDPPYPSAYATWGSKYGGRFLGLEGTADSRNEWQISQAMNAAAPNSAYFCYENYSCPGTSAGGHGCWNTMYNPKVNNWTTAGNANLVASASPGTTMGTYSYNPKTGSNIFQWMLRQGDTSLAGTSSSPVVTLPPVLTTFKSAAQSVTLPRNNCSCGTPTSVTYSVPAGKYSGNSQAVADAAAAADIMANAQAYANTNGLCNPVLILTITTITKVNSDGTSTTTTTTTTP